MSIKYKPQFVLTTYRSDVPEDAFPVSADEPLDNVTLEPYVPDKKPQQLLPIHTRTNRFAVTTAEPLKPAVVYQDQETQTDDVVVSAVPVSCMHVAYQPYKRPEASLLSEKIRLERELDALRLEVEKLSIELHTSRAAEDKMRLEQLERAAEDKMRQTLQQKAREEPAKPGKPVKPAQPAKPAQPPVRTRNHNRVPGPKY